MLKGEDMTEAGKGNLIRDEMSNRIVETVEEIASNDGTKGLTVGKILKKLGITNRVFYNRFHNIGEVLEIVYKKTVQKARDRIMKSSDRKKDYFEYIFDLVESVIVNSYDTRRQMSSFVFETDSAETENREWWVGEIRSIIEYGIEMGYFKKLDATLLSESVWSFIRGYNVDALGRNIPKEDAVKNLRYSFSFLINGMKK